jgi:hypothetical protein
MDASAAAAASALVIVTTNISIISLTNLRF